MKLQVLILQNEVDSLSRYYSQRVQRSMAELFPNPQQIKLKTSQPLILL
ncbi:uncharacterized protein METZ01_LOCUS309765 [marine metagenome]|uniref:Uncharacterized protein n=1 Tax=marine metagenome TaxID=408172 RepID=A0A382NBG3_9ZZZZ